jgi:hypothetical protein
MYSTCNSIYSLPVLHSMTRSTGRISRGQRIDYAALACVTHCKNLHYYTREGQLMISLNGNNVDVNVIPGLTDGQSRGKQNSQVFGCHPHLVPSCHTQQDFNLCPSDVRLWTPQPIHTRCTIVKSVNQSGHRTMFPLEGFTPLTSAI